ncbi:MAG: hypothetical protein QOF77_748 [Solirubrobacteraceae bacterium]|jgi:lipoprotein-anchoring transpeptidase ErfK/SrfK|nr:hypothetical protein [Solirubrobacteraceae bacterium]
MKRRRLLALPAAVVLAVIGAGCAAGGRPAAAPGPSTPAPRPAPGGGALVATPAPGHSALGRPGFSLVAQARHGRVGLYRGPGSHRLVRMLHSPDGRFPLVLLVKQARPGWLQVYLPVRPNQSTGWIRQADVSLRYDGYRVEVDVHRRRLSVWRSGVVLDRQPIGVGQVLTPTPGGIYYIIQEFRLSDPGGPYGPYALGISAYSNVLQSFGSGPGQIALHGTNDPGGIGAKVSHGCIHLRNREITRLAHLLPLGTPVLIRA